MSKTTKNPPYPRTRVPERWRTNYHGGFCSECGGSGRTDNGCSPCSNCNGHGHAVNNLFAALFGGPSPDDPPTHRHKCGKCGFIWEHETDCVNNVSGHTCRECGTQEWFWFHGEGKGPFISCATTK